MFRLRLRIGLRQQACLQGGPVVQQSAILRQQQGARRITCAATMRMAEPGQVLQPQAVHHQQGAGAAAIPLAGADHGFVILRIFTVARQQMTQHGQPSAQGFLFTFGQCRQPIAVGIAGKGLGCAPGFLRARFAQPGIKQMLSGQQRLGIGNLV